MSPSSFTDRKPNANGFFMGIKDQMGKRVSSFSSFLKHISPRSQSKREKKVARQAELLALRLRIQALESEAAGMRQSLEVVGRALTETSNEKEHLNRRMIALESALHNEGAIISELNRSVVALKDAGLDILVTSVIREASLELALERFDGAQIELFNRLRDNEQQLFISSKTIKQLQSEMAKGDQRIVAALSELQQERTSGSRIAEIVLAGNQDAQPAALEVLLRRHISPTYGAVIVSQRLPIRENFAKIFVGTVGGVVVAFRITQRKGQYEAHLMQWIQQNPHPHIMSVGWHGCLGCREAV
ncbi:hypothetical protein HDU93_008916, partial [Gonapodya sp. JEL0774]